MYNYYRVVQLSEVFSIVSLILAIAAMVLSFIFIIPAKKRNKLPKFFQIIHDIFNFNGLVIEVILKALYIVSTIFTILYSFFMIFTGYGVFGWILTMILGPVIIRIVFELIMMSILLVKNVIAINVKLKSQNDNDAPDTFGFDYSKYTADKSVGIKNNNVNMNANNNVNVNANRNVNAQNMNMTSGKVCPNCGNIVSANGTFCNNCGSQINF